MLKTVFRFVLGMTFLISTTALAVLDEKDIPPPPMPEYMKKYQSRNQNAKMPKKSQELNIPVAQEEPEPPAIEDKVALEVAPVAPNTANEEPIAAETPAVVAEESSAPAQPVTVEESAPEVEAPVEEETVAQAEAVAPSELDSREPAEDVEPDTPVVAATEPASTKPVVADQPAPKVAEERAPASVSFKSGMHLFKKDCVMRAEPKAESAKAGKVPAGRKLWIDSHNQNWRKAYKKSGTVYVHASCF